MKFHYLKFRSFISNQRCNELTNRDQFIGTLHKVNIAYYLDGFRSKGPNKFCHLLLQLGIILNNEASVLRVSFRFSACQVNISQNFGNFKNI
jgi:hypothetical protein